MIYLTTKENHQKIIRHILIVLLILGSSIEYGIAQSHVVTAGTNVSSTTGSVSFTVGQIDYINATNGSGNVNQGVQQPYEIYKVTGIEHIQLADLDIQISPNPSSGDMTLSIQCSSFEEKHLSYVVTTITGDKLLQQDITNRQTSLHLKNLSAATYFITICNEHTKVATYKIVKNN
jgi:hypothetical protein